jgi:hypothetical protein
MDTHDHNPAPATPSCDEVLPAGTPVFDFDRYRPRIRHRFVSDEEADAYLTIMAQLMIMMVDFRLDLKTSPALLRLLGETSSEEPQGAVGCADNPKLQFEKSAARDAARKSDSSE